MIVTEEQVTKDLEKFGTVIDLEVNHTRRYPSREWHCEVCVRLDCELSEWLALAEAHWGGIMIHENRRYLIKRLELDHNFHFLVGKPTTFESPTVRLAMEVDLVS